MKKMNSMLSNIRVLLTSITLASVFLSGCATTQTPAPTPPTAVNKPATTPSNKQAGTIQPDIAQTDNTAQNVPKTPSNLKLGDYYLDDGPGDNPPLDIDKISDAIPKTEPLLTRANKPYVALGATYKPMTSYQPYSATGVASWYGKRYHGRKTSSGEVYDMYAMTAAHPTLPLPSYVKVTNPVNGKSVIVRINDRGPFKKDRLIDLSYAAAYKLRFTTSGSSTVNVQAIDASNFTKDVQAQMQPNATSQVNASTNQINSTNEAAKKSEQLSAYFIQAGAFKNIVNADALIKKINGLDISQNALINSVYNNGLYRVKLGPFQNKQQADLVADRIRKQLNTAAVTLFQ